DDRRAISEGRQLLAFWSLLQADQLHARQFGQIRETLQGNIAFAKGSLSGPTLPVYADPQAANLRQLLSPWRNKCWIWKNIRYLGRNRCQRGLEQPGQAEQRRMHIEQGQLVPFGN